MPALIANDALRAGLTWALWRVLDHLAERFLPALLAPPADSSAPGTPAVLAPTIDAALAALRDIDPAELQAALASLQDDSSPLVQSLAWALGAEGLEPAERQRRLEASLAILSRAESFALLAVLLHQAQGR